MFKNFAVIALLFYVLGCNLPQENTTYFGGKIVNPKSNHVILYTMDKVIDTFFLDKHNKFIGKIANAKEGLYYFKHGVENQYIYLEPNDSLMLRLNTWDFDESLGFSGKGADRNNILIDCFLENEKNNKLFYKFNLLKPDDFRKKIDSILQLKKSTYQNYLAEHPNESPGFTKILDIALKYPVYSRLERYPIAHSKYSKKHDFHKLEENFYSHREIVNMDTDSLMYYPAYAQYFRNYLYNLTYSLGHKPLKDEYSSDFTQDLLKIIDKNIDSKKSKNAFLKQTVIGHFYRKSSCDINKETFHTYFDLSSNDEDIKHIKNILVDIDAVKKGTKIIDFNLYDFTKSEHNILDIIKNKNTFLFFWNPEYVSPMYISSRMNYFSNKFPDINFIQIKIDGDNTGVISRLDIKNQYYIDAKSKANQFLSSKMPRSIIINKNGIVENGYASITSSKIYNQLKELSKK